MSPWDVIGWAIAIPFAMFAMLFVGALLVAIVKTAGKKQETKEVKPHPSRRLRIVEDDEPA
jgi:hypothetical protein